jgi:hypothetical protein
MRLSTGRLIDFARRGLLRLPGPWRTYLAQGRPHVLVGTHHKSGTVWMNTTFREIAAATGSRFVDMSREKVSRDRRQGVLDEALGCSRRSIVFDAHSEFARLDPTVAIRGLHMVRDPRAIVVSAARYHAWSKERWLHVPSDRFDGRTYQEAIAACGGETQRVIFELNNFSKATIAAMLAFDGHGVIRTVRYEDLVNDRDMTVWRDLLGALGFDDREVEVASRAVWNNALFGRSAVKSRRHVQSIDQDGWRKHFTPEVDQVFRRLCPDALSRLGYE